MTIKLDNNDIDAPWEEMSVPKGRMQHDELTAHAILTEVPEELRTLKLDIRNTRKYEGTNETYQAFSQAIKKNDIVRFTTLLAEEPTLLYVNSELSSEKLSYEPQPLSLIVQHCPAEFLEVLKGIKFHPQSAGLSKAFRRSLSGDIKNKAISIFLEMGASTKTYYGDKKAFHPLIEAVQNFDINFHVINRIADCYNIESSVTYDLKSHPFKKLIDSENHEEAYKRIQLLLVCGMPADAILDSGQNGIEYALGKEKNTIADLLETYGASDDYGFSSNPLEYSAALDVYKAPDWYIRENIDQIKLSVHKTTTQCLKLRSHIRDSIGDIQGIRGKRIFKSLLSGEIISGYDALPHYQELLTTLSALPTYALKNPDSFIDLILYENSEELEKQLLTLTRYQNFYDRAEAASHKDFFQAIDTQRKKAQLRYQVLDSLTDEDPQGKQSFSESTEAFNIGAGRVLVNRPIIARHIRGDSPSLSLSSSMTPDVYLDSEMSRDILGYSYSLAFIENSIIIENERKNVKQSLREISALVKIDSDILSTFDSIIENDSELRKTAVSALSGIRVLSGLGGHDDIHNIFYGLHNPALESRTHFAQLNDVFVQFFEGRNKFQSIQKLAQFTVDGGKLKNDFEVHAYLTSRAIWDKLFREKKHLKDGVIKRAGNYIEDLVELKTVFTKQHGSKESDKIMAYLATIGLSQLSLMMPIKEIEENQTKNRAGKTLSEALQSLSQEPYQIESRKLLDDFLQEENKQKDQLYLVMADVIMRPENTLRLSKALVKSLNHFKLLPDQHLSENEIRFIGKFIIAFTTADLEGSLKEKDLLAGIKDFCKTSQGSARVNGSMKKLGLSHLEVQQHFTLVEDFLARYSKESQILTTERILIDTKENNEVARQLLLKEIFSSTRPENVPLAKRQLFKLLSKTINELQASSQPIHLHGIEALTRGYISIDGRSPWMDEYPELAVDPLEVIIQFQQELADSGVYDSQDFQDLKEIIHSKIRNST